MQPLKHSVDRNRRGILDPADWTDFRRQAHSLLDLLLDHVAHAADGPLCRPLPEAVARRLAAPAPQQPEAMEQVVGELQSLVLPYGPGNAHPRFFSGVPGAGTAGGMLAAMAAAAINANCSGSTDVTARLEATVIGWARQWFGFPEDAGGLLVSGSSMANLLGLAVARHHHCSHDVRTDGLQGAPLVGYASAEVHFSVIKAFELLGLGRRALRLVAVEPDCRMDLAALAQSVAADRAAGLRPFCVAGAAGSVRTGAIDDLAAIAAFCRAEKLWLHVDAAFAGLLVLAPELGPRLTGIALADSLAFDFHKWLHVPYDAGCLLVRDRTRQLAAFDGRPDYLTPPAGDDAPWPCELGIELSRPFRALKVWFTVKEHGTVRLGQAIARNCAQAQALAARLRARPDVRLFEPVTLNIVCWRHLVPGLDAPGEDAFTAGVVDALGRRGIALLSTVRLQGRVFIRLCITNHRSDETDFDLLLAAIDGIVGAPAPNP